MKSSKTSIHNPSFNNNDESVPWSNCLLPLSSILPKHFPYCTHTIYIYILKMQSSYIFCALLIFSIHTRRPVKNQPVWLYPFCLCLFLLLHVLGNKWMTWKTLVQWSPANLQLEDNHLRRHRYRYTTTTGHEVPNLPQVSNIIINAWTNSSTDIKLSSLNILETVNPAPVCLDLDVILSGLLRLQIS